VTGRRLCPSFVTKCGQSRNTPKANAFQYYPAFPALITLEVSKAANLSRLTLACGAIKSPSKALLSIWKMDTLCCMHGGDKDAEGAPQTWH
jgi:hypothetical protein